MISRSPKFPVLKMPDVSKLNWKIQVQFLIHSSLSKNILCLSRVVADYSAAWYLDPLIWVKKLPAVTGWRSGGKCPSSRAARGSVYHGEAAVCWTHEEGKLRKPVLLQRQNTWSCRLSSSCRTLSHCEDFEGLSFQGQLLVLLAGARLGTEIWKEMRT